MAGVGAVGLPGEELHGLHGEPRTFAEDVEGGVTAGVDGQGAGWRQSGK